MDQLTVLSNQHYHFAKEFYLDGNDITSNAYPNCSKFQWYTIDVDSLESLAKAIVLLEQQSSSFIVRGHLAPESPDVILRRMYKPDSPDTYLHDVARQWLMIDIDKLDLPDGLDIVNDTQTSIEYAVSMLPKEFHDVSYYWSLSSSAGVKSTKHISVHLFFWLEKPISNDTLRQWAMAYNSYQGFKLIDYALFNAVQPHYLANPKFRAGVNDPFEERQRSGLFHKTKDVAAIDLSVINLVLEERINTNQSRLVSSSSTKGFENIIALLGDGDGCEGFNDVLLRATASYVSKHGGEETQASINELKATLRTKIKEADASRHTMSELQRYLSDSYLDNIINSAIYKFGNKKDVPPHFDKPELNIEEGEKQLQEALKRFGKSAMEYYADPIMKEPPKMVIKATAGLGKTTGIIAELTKYSLLEHGDIHYYVPNHALSANLEEQVDDAITITTPNVILKRSQVIHGRDAENCMKSSLAKRISDLGIPVSKYLCKSDNHQCEHYNHCQYQQQFSDVSYEDISGKDLAILTQVNIMTHNHLYLNTKERLPKHPSLTVIDESFFILMLDTEEFPLNDVNSIGPIASFIAIHLLNHKPKLLAELRNRYSVEEIRAEANEGLETFRTKLKPSMDAIDQDKILKTTKRQQSATSVLFALAEELEITDRSESHRISTNLSKDRHLQVEVHHRRELSLPNSPMLIIDADAETKILDKFISGYEFVDIRVKRKAKVFQAVDQTFATTKLLQDEIKLEQIRSFISRVGITGKTLVCCTKKLRMALTGETSPEQVSEFDGVAFVHFGYIRGLNHFKEYDNVIIVGREQLPTQALESDARCLYWDDETLHLLTDSRNPQATNLDTEHRGLRTPDGNNRSVVTQIHPDNRIQLLLEQSREAESLQALDRLRLLRDNVSGNDRNVFILSNLPLDIDVDRVFSFDRLQTVLTMYEECGGYLPDKPKQLAARLGININTAKDRLKWIKELQTLLQIFV